MAWINWNWLTRIGAAVLVAGVVMTCVAGSLFTADSLPPWLDDAGYVCFWWCLPTVFAGGMLVAAGSSFGRRLTS